MTSRSQLASGLMNQRKKTLVTAGVTLVVVWFLALGGFLFARSMKVTREKVTATLHGARLEGMSDTDRAKRLKRLADELNQLNPDDRRLLRQDREWERLFREMKDKEKLNFIDDTVPAGMKQALDGFEKLDPGQRQRAVADALKRMKDAQNNPEVRAQWGNRPPPPPMDERMRQRIMEIGLGAFFSESSAQTKAELAPVLEEIQRSMESGRLFRGRREDR